MTLVTPHLLNASTFYSLSLKHRDEALQALQHINGDICADFLFIGAVDTEKNLAHANIAIKNDRPIESFSYELKHSPCEQVFQTSACYYPENVAQIFPKDEALKEMGIEGYLGVPLFNDKHKPIGIFVALFESPSNLTSTVRSMFETIAEQTSLFFQARFLSSLLEDQNKLLVEACTMSSIGHWEMSIEDKKINWSDQVSQITETPIMSVPLSFKESAAHLNLIEQGAFIQMFEKAMTEKNRFSEIFAIAVKGDKQLWFKISGTIELDNNRNVRRLFGFLQNITNEQTKFEAQKLQTDFTKNIFDSLNEAIIITDSNGIIREVNSMTYKMFGYKDVQLVGSNVSKLMPSQHRHQHDHYIHNYLTTGIRKKIGQGRQLFGQRRDGSTFQVEITLNDTVFSGERLFLAIVRDVSERLKAQDTIYQLAYIDPLTSLENKDWFKKHMDEWSSNADTSHPFMLCALLDIDNLSQHNILYGMDFGDKVVARVSEYLKTKLNDGFLIFKNGVDSFFVVSKGSGKNEFDNNIAEIRHIVSSIYESHVNVDGAELIVSTSIATTIVHAKTYSFDVLMSKLEFAMLSAKKSSPNGLYSLTEDDVQAYQFEEKIRYLLRDVTEKNELRLVLQPQYNAHNKIVSSEALLRWHSEELGPVEPSVFIPLAEESEAIISIGAWVLDRVCALLAELKKKRITTNISVNVSGRHIIQDDFTDLVTSLAKKYQIDLQQLTIELTETALVSDVTLAKKPIEALSALGCRISIDDFGTGYSNLNYLMSLPISELKIDKVFVDDIHSAQSANNNTKIVDLIIHMAKALNVVSIAEGVETKEQRAYVEQRGCDIIQGFILSKPLDIDEWLTKMCKQNH